jgi:hypothetical protein
MDWIVLPAALIALCVGVVLGGAIGLLLGWNRGRAGSEQARVQLARLLAERQVNEERMRWLDSAEAKMRETFDPLMARSPQSASDELLKRVPHEELSACGGVASEAPRRACLFGSQGAR